MDDVDMLEEDLQLLKSLFDAEGEGLSRQQIEELCAPLAGLLVVMQLDSGILMGNYKQVPAAIVLCMHFSGAGRITTRTSLLPCSFAEAASPQAPSLTTMMRAPVTSPPGLQQAEDDVVQAMSKTKGQDLVIDPLGPANNPQTIIAILAHRADRSASKFLKKELSMPKTAEDSPKSMASFGTAAISFSRFRAKITRRH